MACDGFGGRAAAPVGRLRLRRERQSSPGGDPRPRLRQRRRARATCRLRFRRQWDRDRGRRRRRQLGVGRPGAERRRGSGGRFGQPQLAPRARRTGRRIPGHRPDRRHLRPAPGPRRGPCPGIRKFEPAARRWRSGIPAGRGEDRPLPARRCPRPVLRPGRSGRNRSGTVATAGRRRAAARQPSRDRTHRHRARPEGPDCHHRRRRRPTLRCVPRA
jgi:hypothetical protein